MEVMSLLAFLVPGKAAADLRPVKGATKVACAGLARLTVATVAEEIIEEAIAYIRFLFFPFFLLSFSSELPSLLSWETSNTQTSLYNTTIGYRICYGYNSIDLIFVKSEPLVYLGDYIKLILAT